jgi:preprotein translocase SecE subunit
MARNRQKAKQRKARQGPRKPEQASTRPVEARSDVASTAGEAPPQDSGFTNTDAVEVKDEIKREVKAKKKKVAAAKAQPKAAAEPKQRGRLVAFLRSSWAELRRVQWPDRKQITTLTSIVIGFVMIAGAYLGVIDWVANKVVNMII